MSRAEHVHNTGRHRQDGEVEYAFTERLRTVEQCSQLRGDPLALPTITGELVWGNLVNRHHSVDLEFL